MAPDRGAARMTPASEHQWRLPYLVGCAVDCARWVLPLCHEYHRAAAEKVVGLANDYVQGRPRIRDKHVQPVNQLLVSMPIQSGCVVISYVVLPAVRAVLHLASRDGALGLGGTARDAATGRATDHAIAAIENAKDFIGAGAVQILEARWILRDLNDGSVPEHLQDAAMGALSVSVELACEVLGVSPR